MAKTQSKVGPAAIGVGVAALAAAAAGAYYFYGKNGPQHRRNLKSWAVKARGEVMEKVEGLSKISKESYHGAVNDVMKKYKTLKKATPSEWLALSKELKGHWDAISAELDKAGKKRVAKSRSR